MGDCHVVARLAGRCGVNGNCQRAADASAFPNELPRTCRPRRPRFTLRVAGSIFPLHPELRTRGVARPQDFAEIGMAHFDAPVELDSRTRWVLPQRHTTTRRSPLNRSNTYRPAAYPCMPRAFAAALRRGPSWAAAVRRPSDQSGPTSTL